MSHGNLFFYLHFYRKGVQDNVLGQMRLKCVFYLAVDVHKRIRWVDKLECLNTKPVKALVVIIMVILHRGILGTTVKRSTGHYDESGDLLSSTECLRWATRPAKSANSKASERLWILRSKIKPIMMSLVLWKARDKQKVMSGKPYPFRIRLYCMVLFGFGSGVAWHRWACTAKRRSSESTLSWRNTLSLTFTPIGKLWSP